MTGNIIKLLKEYIIFVDSVKEVAFQDFQVETKKEFLGKKMKYINGEFSVASENIYVFHGRGCRLLNKVGSEIVDWDFGFDEIWCGVNPGLFLNYLSIHHQIDNTYSNYNKVEAILKELVDLGTMTIKYDLYYFSDSHDNIDV